MTLFEPATADDLRDIIRDARTRGEPLHIVGGGTRRGLGRPVSAAATLSTRRLTGITLYEPAELVISARAGTPLAEIEAALASNGQMLPFEPMDHRAIYSGTAEPTIGGVVAVNASGPRRLMAGACRDSLLGVTFVNGRGEIIRAGGRVMKNVTGLDLVKLVAGSFGTLGVLTEVTFRVVPRPPCVATLIWTGLDTHRAVELMTAATGTPFGIAAAAHLPATASGAARTLLRLEYDARAVEHRANALRKTFAHLGAAELAEGEAIDDLWAMVRDGALVAADPQHAVWRVSTAPSRGAQLAAAIGAARSASVVFDWAGGLVWIATPLDDDAGAAVIRSEVVGAGGHATLVRAPDEMRARRDVFEPQQPALRAIAKRLKASFDPDGVLNPGRMYRGI